MSELPAYVVRPGEAVHCPPYSCTQARLFGFYLKGDRGIIQERLVDPILNAPTEGSRGSAALDYRVFSDQVMVTYAFARGSSLDPPDSNVGWVGETSWTVWIPLLATKTELGVRVAERLVFYPAYIVVDVSWSVAAGREVYGFPKGQGPITMPAAGEPPLSFSASTLVMKTFAPQNEAAVAPLMQVTRIGESSGEETLIRDLGAARKAIAEIWSAEMKDTILPGFGLMIDLLELLADEEVPCVFLKQFRDAADGASACYQAIVEAGSYVTTFRGMTFLTGRYQATVADFDSHPLASDLGLPQGPVPIEIALSADFDFTVHGGRVLWKAGG